MYQFNESNWSVDIAEPQYSSVSLNDDTACFEKNSFAKAIIRHVTKDFEVGKTYRFSVKLNPEKVESVIYPYAIVGFMAENGGFLERIFANNTTKEGCEKELVYTVPEGTVAVRFELGFKGCGKVTWQIPSVEECAKPEVKKAVLASVYVPTCPTLEIALEKIIQAVDKAGEKNPDLIALSEVIYDFGAGIPIPETAENIKEGGTFLNAMKEKAKQYSCYIVANLHEKDDDNHYYNTSVLIGRDGEVVGKYSKTHNSMSEFEKGVTPGNEYPVFDTDIGKIGMLICWDAYFPEPARILTQNGADLIVVSTVGDAAHRHIARAMENGVYVLVSGNHFANLNNCGILPCKIIDPQGHVLSHTINENNPAVAEVDLGYKLRTGYLSIPGTMTDPHNIYANDRRPDLYKQMSQF